MQDPKRVVATVVALVALVVVPATAQRDTVHKIGLFDTTTSALTNLKSFKAMPLAAADYGAKCDDAADDAAAINAALTEAGHTQFATLGAGSQMVILPPGICRINTTLHIPASVVLMGLGRSVTEIKIGRSWANPTPNALVRLGDDTTPAYGSRVENLSINALGRLHVISIYAKGIQNHSGARNVTLRAFGWRGVLVDTGGHIDANAYMLEHIDALNGRKSYGIGYELKSRLTFSPTLIDLSQSNATFVSSGYAPPGIQLDGGGTYRLYNTTAEDDSACVNAIAGTTVEIYGLACQQSIDAFRTAQSSSMAFGVTNPGGVNLVKDNILNITIPVVPNYWLPSYIGGARTAAASAFALRKVTLTYSSSIAVAVGGAALFQVIVTNGDSFTIQAPTGLLSTTSNQTQFITFDIYRNSRSAMGPINWTAGTGGYRLAGAFTNPATNGSHRTITFFFDENANAWRELSRSAADIPN